MVAAFDENVEFGFEGGEVPDACTHVGELAADQGRHMSTGDVADVAEVDDAADLGERALLLASDSQNSHGSLTDGVRQGRTG